MKKMMRALAVVPVLVGLAAGSAIAEERLSIGGEMRVRGWTTDYDIAGVSTSRTWADQRMRLAGKFTIAEGVKVIFRMDATEADWGRNSGFGSGRFPGNNSMQWDRAYIELDKGMAQFRAGQIFVELSPSAAVNSQDNGIQLAFKNEAAPFKFFALLDDDNFDQADPEAIDGSDAFLFGAGVKPVIGPVTTEFFAAGYEGGANDQSVYAFGASASANAGIATIFGEVDFFTGDAATDVDAVGFQGYVGADFGISDATKVQAIFWYAQAADADEVQYTVLGNDFAGWDPVWEMGTKLSNEAIDLGRPFDWTGAGAGVIGVTLKAFADLSDAAKVGATIGYLTVEDDGIVDADAWALGVGGSYKIMDNTSVHAQVQYTNGEVESEDLEAIEAGLGIFVNF